MKLRRSQKQRQDSSRVVAITGAASGIGRALAQTFSAPGQHNTTLLLADRDQVGLEETKNLCSACTVDTQVLDIADVDAVKAWADRVVAEFGVPDEVHHVAGVSLWGDARTLPHEKWKRVIDINLMGSVHMVEAFAGYLGHGHKTSGKVSNRARKKPQRKPRRKLVFVSSAAGFIGLPWHAAYSASKAGVIGMAEVLRFDLKPLGVDVHVVAPGAVDTPLVHSIDIHGVDRENKRVQKATALFQGHAVTPEKAAEKIRTGVRKNKYLITTSGDIAFGRWAQVNAPWVYKGFMSLLNRAFMWVAR